MYYAYTRVSTETQAEKGYGLDAQREAIEKYAAREGIEIAAFYTDAGISGAAKDTADDSEALEKRAGLLALLANLKAGDVVIVLNTSRLWRSDITKVLIRRELLKAGARVQSIEQPRYDIFATDPNDRLISSMLELLDEWDRGTVNAKLARGRATKAAAGQKPAGCTPFGYRYSADGKTVVVYEPEAKIVKRMFREGQQGRTLSQIADGLNRDQIKTRRGNEWTRGSVRVILRNRFYIGELQHDGKPIQGAHTPIVSKIQFGKVSAQLKRRHK